MQFWYPEVLYLYSNPLRDFHFLQEFIVRLLVIIVYCWGLIVFHYSLHFLLSARCRHEMTYFCSAHMALFSLLGSDRVTSSHRSFYLHSETEHRESCYLQAFSFTSFIGSFPLNCLRSCPIYRLPVNTICFPCVSIYIVFYCRRKICLMFAYICFLIMSKVV